MTYDSSVAALSPRLFWKLNESSGSTMTNSGSVSGNGSYVGTPTYSAGALYGSGQSIRFNATNASQGSLNSEVTAYTQCTVCAWVKPSTALDPYVLGAEFSGTVPWALGRNGNDVSGSYFTFALYDGSGWRIVSSTTAVTAGSTYFLAGTIDTSGVLKIYVNGSLETTSSSGSRAFSGWTGSSLLVSRRWDSSTFGSGTNQNVVDTDIAGGAIFNSDIGATAIADLYTAGGGVLTQRGFNNRPVRNRQAVVRAAHL